MAGWIAFASSYLLVVTVAVGVAAWGWSDPAVAAGRETYSHRRNLAGPAEPVADHSRRVSWLGDSTILPPFSYPWVAGKRIGAGTTVMALPGIDAFAFYCAISRELDRTRPKVLGLVANVATLHRGFGKPVNDLVSELPLAELPNSVALPLHEFGLTVPQLLLLRALRWPRVEAWLFFIDGVHRLAREALVDAWAGPVNLPPLDNWPELVRSLNVSYAEPFSARTAKVQFLRAAVRIAHEHGIRTLVVVGPLPVHQLQATGHYDAALFDARITALSAEIQRAGGMLVDLHDVIPPEGFGDAVGHLNEHGHQLAAERVHAALYFLLARSAIQG